MNSDVFIALLSEKVMNRVGRVTLVDTRNYMHAMGNEALRPHLYIKTPFIVKNSMNKRPSVTPL